MKTLLFVLAFAVTGIVSGCRPKKPAYQNRTMDEWLQILKADTNSPGNPLRIAQISYDNKWQTVIVEVPLSYDLLKDCDFFEKNGKLGLAIGDRGLSTFCERATNGNCLLGFDENNIHFGTNHIRAEFFISNPLNLDRPLHAEGPIAQLVSSNSIQVNAHVFPTASFDGVVLWADLSVSNATFSIELLDTNGNHIKTISGVTSNGVINERWNLVGDSGNIYPRDAFSPIFRVGISNSLSGKKP